MSNNTNIDKEKVLADLGQMVQIYSSDRPSKDSILKDYSSFYHLNVACAKIFLESYQLYGLFCNPQEVQELVNKYYARAYKKIVQTCKENKETILNTFKNYSDLLKDLDFSFLECDRDFETYSEKDFKDIIYAYYSTYGNKYYCLAKKYFDENRIQMRYEEIEKKYIDLLLTNCKSEEERKEILDIQSSGSYKGYYLYLIGLESGYILSKFNGYNTLSAHSIVHELGHAVDAETFLFPQQKKISRVSDILMEMPSTTFEMGFIDFLRDNGLDEYGADIISSERYEVLNDIYDCILPVYEQNKFELDEDGNVKIDDEEYEFRDDIIYGLGGYFAVCLQEIRRQNPKEFLKIFNNILTMRAESSLEELINMTGISYEDFVSAKFIRPRLEEEKKLLSKRFNV